MNNTEEKQTIIIPDIMVPFDDKGMQHRQHEFVRYVNKETGDVKEFKDGIWNDKTYEVKMVHPVLEQNFAFEDSLEFDKMHVNKGSVFFTFKSVNNGLIYYVSATEFDIIINEMIRGIVHGVFSFKKQGKYYSIYMLTY